MKITVRHRQTEVTVDENLNSDYNSFKYKEYNEQLIRLLNEIFKHIKELNEPPKT